MPTLPPVIAFAGKVGSGKTTIANELALPLKAGRYSFANPLRRMLRGLLMDGGMEYYEAKEWLTSRKEEPCPVLDGKTIRHALQTLGTEWGREHMGEYFWANRLKDFVHNAPVPVIVDDVRFLSERDVVKELDGITIYVHRPDNRPAIAVSQHSSENSILPSHCDHAVYNSGTIEMLKTHILTKIL